MRNKKYTDQELINSVSSSLSIREVLKKLNLKPTGGNYKHFYNTCKNLQINTSHFTGQGHLKGKTHNYNSKAPLSELLILGSSVQSHKLKIRLIKEGILDNKCSRCEITEWCGEKLSLHLDHIDGNHTNNQLDNLRLLCPNCHSLTDTYCGKNKKKHSGSSRT